MPVDSFESPLTLAACGGHYELAGLLLSKGADLEEVNDEGWVHSIQSLVLQYKAINVHDAYLND